MKAVRWLSVLPILIGYLAYFVGGALNNASIIFVTGSPLHGWIAIFTDAMAHVYLGAAFTYAAVRIAPGYPKIVASVALGLVVMFAGVSIWSMFVTGRWFVNTRFDATFALIGFLFGAVGAFLGALRGEVVPYKSAERIRGS